MLMPPAPPSPLLPPWTFVNLTLHALSSVAGWGVLARSTYASMWGVAVSFQAVLLLDPTTHRRLADKQGMGLLSFRVFDGVVHWLPLWACRVPPLSVQVDAVGVATNLAWGCCASRGSMLLDAVYVPLPNPSRSWAILWCVAASATLLAP